MSPTIVISYRRDDSKWITRQIYERLEARYGKKCVFMDIDAIPVGLDFRKHIQETLDKCDVLLAIIGPQWAGTGKSGQTRLASERDWVRIELETALQKTIPVIPVLIDNAPVPDPKRLPKSLRDFSFRQAAEVDGGRNFHSDIDRLIRRNGGCWPAAETTSTHGGCSTALSPTAPRCCRRRPRPQALRHRRAYSCTGHRASTTRPDRQGLPSAIDRDTAPGHGDGARRPNGR